MFEITFPSMTTSNTAENNKDINFIVREISTLLEEMGLQQIIYVSGSSSTPRMGDYIH